MNERRGVDSRGYIPLRPSTKPILWAWLFQSSPFHSIPPFHSTIPVHRIQTPGSECRQHFFYRNCMYVKSLVEHDMVKVRSVESVPLLRYLCLCNVLCICNIRAILTVQDSLCSFSPLAKEGFSRNEDCENGSVCKLYGRRARFQSI